MIALSLQGVSKNFGATQIISNLSLDVRAGERHAIIGPNGAGKSTLFNLISGRFKISQGRITLLGRDIAGLKPFQINRGGLSRSFQVTNFYSNLSVFDNLVCGLLWHAGYRYSFWHNMRRLDEVNQRTELVMREIGLAHRRDDEAGTLSYAEQRSLEIGITIAGGADVVMLDEPTAGMSWIETAHFVTMIRKISTGRTLIMVEHDMGVVFELADRISVLVHGQIIATDTPENIRKNKAVQEAYLGHAVNAEDGDE